MKFNSFAPLALLAAGSAMVTLAAPVAADDHAEAAAPALADVLAHERRDDDRARDIQLVQLRAHRIHRRLIEHPNSVIQDRSVYEDAEVFAHNLFRQGQISTRDYDTYRELYQVLSEFLPWIIHRRVSFRPEL